MRKMVAQGSQRWPKGAQKGAKSGPKALQTWFWGPWVRYGIYCTNSILGGPGGVPKETKIRLLFQNPPKRGPEVHLWPKGGQKDRKLEPKGSPKWSKKRQKGVPKTRPHSYCTLWAPMGGPGSLLGGFGVDFWWILGRFLEDSGAHFLYLWGAFPAVLLVVLQVCYIFLHAFFIRHHVLRHFPVLYVSPGIIYNKS